MLHFYVQLNDENVLTWVIVTPQVCIYWTWGLVPVKAVVRECDCSAQKLLMFCPEPNETIQISTSSLVTANVPRGNLLKMFWISVKLDLCQSQGQHAAPHQLRKRVRGETHSLSPSNATTRLSGLPSLLCCCSGAPQRPAGAEWLCWEAPSTFKQYEVWQCWNSLNE